MGLVQPESRQAPLPLRRDPPGPVEDGYYWAQACLDEDGAYRAWRKESFVQTGERRELPTYDAEGTEIARRIETFRWYSRAMGVRNVGSAVPNVVDAGVGDDDPAGIPSKSPDRAPAHRRLRPRPGRQVQHRVQRHRRRRPEIQETSSWYSPRTAMAGVPWFLNYSGAGQKDLLAPFQRVIRKTTTNTLTDDGLLAGTIEATTASSPRSASPAPSIGEIQKSNVSRRPGAPSASRPPPTTSSTRAATKSSPTTAREP